MGTGRLYQAFGDEVDTSSAPSAVTTVSSAGAAPTNGTVVPFRVRDFDAATDESIALSFWLPSNYSSGGTLNITWLCTGATSGNVVWKTAFLLVHPASEGAPTDLDAASYGTVTSSSALAVPGTAGQTKQSALDLAVTGAHAGDVLEVFFGRDANNASDTAAADVRLKDKWYLSFTTV